MKPGSAGPGMPGIHPIIFDDEGNVVPRGAGQGRQHLHPEPLAGHLPDHLGRPRPLRAPRTTSATARTPRARTGATGRTWPATRAVEAPDGYFRILGRVDDVINVSGHRLGTKELESAALTVPEVAEAAVVPVAHEIKGREPDIYVALKPGYAPSKELEKKISDAI